MSFLKKNIFNKLSFTVALFSVFFLLQSQTASAGFCSSVSGTCYPTAADCPSGTAGDPTNSTDCIFNTPMCCAPTNGAQTCAQRGGTCNATNTCTGGALIGAPGCTTAAKPYCCTGGATTTTPPCTSLGVPAGCTGTPVPGVSASIPFPNPLKFTTVEGVLGGLLGALQSIIVVLSLVFIVIGAVLYITSAGNDGRMKTAKGAITASMIGLAIGIAAPSFLKQIASILGWNTTETSLTGAKTLTEIALSVLQFLLSIVGILGIIMLVIGGIMYLTAAGDEHRIDSGKEIVKYAIIGIVVALAALVIVTQIAALFV